MALSQKQYTNFARTQIATSGGLNNTTNPITLNVDDGSVFATIANGQRVVISATTDPMNDSSREVAEITARTGNSITLSRPNAVTHAGKSYVFCAPLAADFTDLGTAITALEGSVATKGPIVYDAVVASSGGDYTSVNAALTAGARSIFVKSGTYSETTAMSTAWTGTESIYIVGEDRATTILQLPNNASGYFTVNTVGSYISNLTIKAGTTALADNTTNGYITLSGARCVLENCDIYGNNSNVVGTTLIVSGAASLVRNCHFPNNSSNGGDVYIKAVEVTIDRCTFVETRATPVITTATSTTADKTTITGCKITASGQAVVLNIYGARSILSNTTVINTYSSAATSSYTVSMNGTPCVVSGNTIKSTINCLNVNNQGSVTGNTFDVSSTGATQNAWVMKGFSANGTVFTGNLCIGGANAGGGLQLPGDCVITGNYFTNFSAASTITVSTDGDTNVGQNFFSNCTVWQNQSATTQTVPMLQAVKTITASGANTTLNIRQYPGYVVTMTASTTFAFTVDAATGGNLRFPMFFEIIIVQGGSGSYTVTWPASVVWPGGSAPTLTTTVAKRDIFQFRYDPTADKYYGSTVGLNY